jgi:hypothetical protein
MDIFESKYTAEDLETAIGAVLDPYEAGKKAEYDHFWDIYQDYGRFTSYGEYNSGFSGVRWTDEIFKPKYPIVPTVANAMFRATAITDLTKDGVVLDFSNCTSFYGTFTNAGNLKKVPFIDMSKATETGAAFYNSGIEKLHIRVSEKVPLGGTTFDLMTQLTDLIFEGTIGTSLRFVHSSLLTAEAVQSVIDHLKNLTGQTAQTLTFHATVGAKLTNAQKAAITAKNWTLVY